MKQAKNPAIIGEATLVPPIISFFPLNLITTPVWGSASADISGIQRPDVPFSICVWYIGFG